MRHLLLLTSAYPDFSHFQAGRTVCALLAEEFGRQIEKVTVGVCGGVGAASPDAASRFGQRGIDVVMLSAKRANPPPRRSRIENAQFLARALLLNDERCDDSYPDDAQGLARNIDAVGADVALLFWDTAAEFALPYSKVTTFGYTARPPYAAGLSRLEILPWSFRRTLNRALFKATERRHLGRMRRLRGSANICALDAAYYARHGVPCTYVSNTWDDPVGSQWRAKREQHEGARAVPQILANLGALDATGNSFGLRYLGREVLPVLSEIASHFDWTISICGRNQPLPDIAALLDHPRVQIKGFVEDIDAEMLSSAVFLLLNNAGPYTGGYTRVIYALATGACLVAHARLRESMPELISEDNCLLSDTPEGIARHVKRLIEDCELRRAIGARARRTYEESYAPRYVVKKLINMMSAGRGPR